MSSTSGMQGSPNLDNYFWTEPAKDLLRKQVGKENFELIIAPRRHIIVKTVLHKDGYYYDYYTKCGLLVQDHYSKWKTFEKCERCEDK